MLEGTAHVETAALASAERSEARVERTRMSAAAGVGVDVEVATLNGLEKKYRTKQIKYL